MPPEMMAGMAWLFSLDPYKFVRGHRQNVGVIDRDDLVKVADVASAYARSKRPGCCLLFVYGMYKPERVAFYEAVEALFTSAFSSRGILCVADGAKKHVALVLANDDAILRTAANQAMPLLRGVIADRDPAQALPWNYYEQRA